MTGRKIVQRFDAAASGYDASAVAQAEIAQHLVDWAIPPKAPAEILDIGSGTGFVGAAASTRWPNAEITALDAAPNMLQEAQAKIPKLKTIFGDAAQMDIEQRFDVIFCSMLLHWLPDPRAVLRRWQGWLRPAGRLYVAVLVEGSFREWRDFCAAEGLKDGLWPMPSADFADGLAQRAERHGLPVPFASALAFLQSLKGTGASVPRTGHKPLDVVSMRRMLGGAPQSFSVSYETLYIELPSSSPNT